MSHKIALGLSYDDVLLVPNHSEIESRELVDLSTQITQKVRLQLPLISVNMSNVTEEKMAIAMAKLRGLGFIHRFLSAEKQAEMVSKVKKQGCLVGATVGIKAGYVERADKLAKAGVDILTIDVAHGAMQKCIDATKLLKSRFKNKVDIVSGVIATYEGAHDLFKAGADAVRVGVGPGTICTTRITTGVGVPQITAVMQASRAARKFKRTVFCDGGTKNSGDIVKGLAAGASAVVISSQFAGTDEAPGEIIVKDGKEYKSYNASNSLAEKKNHVKTLKNTSKNYLKHIEGVEAIVPCKGPVAKVVSRIKANIKSGFSYCGARNINELWKKAKFMRVTQLGVKESGAHDVFVQKETY